MQKGSLALLTGATIASAVNQASAADLPRKILDNGNLDGDLIGKVFERDTEFHAAEQKFWLLHNHNPDIGTVN